MAQETLLQTATIHVTEKAATKIQELLAKEGVPAETGGLRVGVQGGGCSGLTYAMRLDTQARDQAASKAWWRTVGAVNLIHCRNESNVSWTTRGQGTRRLPPEQVAGRLAGGLA